MDLLRSWYTPIIAQRFVVTHWVGGWSMSLRRGSLSLEGFGFLRENLIGVFELFTDPFGRRAAE